MQISNREEANKYYQIINELVDEYIDKWKIRPSNLKRYLQPGSERFNKFLERNKLKEIKGTEIILKDVVEDRYNMEKDGVVTFESFNFFESIDFKMTTLKQCLYKGIEKSTIAMEKAIADFFDTNLGSIDIEDAEKHIFKIDDWEGETIKVVIYSAEELDVIKFNIIEHIYNELTKQKVKITDSIEIDLENIIDYDNFVSNYEKKYDEDFIVKIVTECLGDNTEFKFDREHNEVAFFVWIL